MAGIRDGVAVHVFHSCDVFGGGGYRGGDRDGRQSADDPGQCATDGQRDQDDDGVQTHVRPTIKGW
jgi:hypothetical protein